jgi:hypothetical protein
MNTHPPRWFVCIVAIIAIVAVVDIVRADSPADGATEKPAAKTDDSKEKDSAAAASPATSETPPPASTAKPAAKPKFQPFADVLGEAEAIDGLVKLYRKDTKLFAELTPGDMNKDFIVLISIARGIARGHLMAGMSRGFGDDWLWQFRKADDRIQIVRRNVRFRAARGTPQEKAVRLAYTDSVLFSMPIITVSPRGNPIVDLTPVFMSDLPQIGPEMKGFMFAADRSNWASVKGFKDNIELQVAATYASSGAENIDTVADSRGATIHVHYSISRLPETGYEPRLADDRVGHFLTVVKDFTKAPDPDRFVRYVNRWDLRKADPTAEMSPPKTPIIFWLEKTIPFKYRAAIREGILEWNKAFEKVGIVNAIEVRQQPDSAEWDPEDINYNTFRWITSSASMAIGPSRVNPLTGQILDADILFDADFLNFWKDHYETFEPRGHGVGCQCAEGMAQQLALASLVLAEGQKPASKELIEELISQAIRSIATHEVGHTLGLRHNFKASSYLTLDEMADPEKTRQGIANSVMDYLPMNIAPKGQKQGPYFNMAIGPYDYWAIEYAYRPLGGGEGELAQLRKIASRCGEPALVYGTDEDAQTSDPDPLCIRYDLGKDPVQFGRRQALLFQQTLPDLVDRMTGEGDGYQRVRRALNTLLANYGNGMYYASRMVGGVYVHRAHKGDAGAPPPMVVVEPAKQREAMDLLQQQILGEEALQLPPKLYAYMAPAYWNHWGVERLQRSDYPVHDLMSQWQDRVLAQLLSPRTLSRLGDNELKVPADQDAFTVAELLERLSAAVFSETKKLQAGEYTNRKPGINSLRRSLQRRYVERLAELALGTEKTPATCSSVVQAELETLQQRVREAAAANPKLDGYTRAHLKEIESLIRKVLDAKLQQRGP